LITYGLLSTWRGRLETGLALTSHALTLALEHDLPTPALRAYNNIADNLTGRDRYDEALANHDTGLKLARRVGNRRWEWQLLVESTYPLALTGRWDEALARIREVPESQVAGALALPPLTPFEIEVARGRVAEARRMVSLLPEFETATDHQARAVLGAVNAVVLRAEGRHAEAFAVGEMAFEARKLLTATHQAVKVGFVEAVEAAFALGDLETVDRLLATVDELRPGEIAPFVRAQTSRFRARFAAERAEPERVEAGFKSAESIFREFGAPFWLAVTQLEHAEWLVGQGRADEAEPLLAEARELFERLEARPWLERATRALPARVEAKLAG
jgi:hypothetical protein